MIARRMGAAVVLALGLGVAGLGGPPQPVALRALRPIAATTNHAAIVIDTGREVKKFCLAFPEQEISGAEALRRIDAKVVFANFGSRGQAVCSLCGTGCPSSDCFCDPNRFWAYHRAGPGGAQYAYSNAGASSTDVRDGDVEGWKWGGGEAPPAAKVSEVCNIEEPPARTSTGATTTEPAPSTTQAPRTDPDPDTDPSPAPSPTAAPAPNTATPARPPAGSPSTVTAPADVAAAARSELGDGTEAPPQAEGDRSIELEDGPDPLPRVTASSPSGKERGAVADRVATVAFVALLASILAWRARLRRSKVRRAGPVR